jgi:hypothetical protein
VKPAVSGFRGFEDLSLLQSPVAEQDGGARNQNTHARHGISAHLFTLIS